MSYFTTQNGKEFKSKININCTLKVIFCLFLTRFNFVASKITVRCQKVTGTFFVIFQPFDQNISSLCQRFDFFKKAQIVKPILLCLYITIHGRLSSTELFLLTCNPGSALPKNESSFCNYRIGFDTGQSSRNCKIKRIELKSQ